PDILLAAPTMDTINAMRRYINGTDPIYFGAVAINRFEAVKQAAAAEDAPAPMPAQAALPVPAQAEATPTGKSDAAPANRLETLLMRIFRLFLFWLPS
ncbi:MAG: hypothetical protein FWH26_08520, partial [Oscillospiraceae bacterium]|nr:hypothetical protein [Oscillospiraceae bacterium]